MYFIQGFRDSSLKLSVLQPPPRRKPPPPPPPIKGIGEFPFNRGETPIFNFDEGDGAFLKTIPSLIDGLHDMARYVQAQTKIPQMYSKVFLNCPDCKP